MSASTHSPIPPTHVPATYADNEERIESRVVRKTATHATSRSTRHHRHRGSARHRLPSVLLTSALRTSLPSLSSTATTHTTTSSSSFSLCAAHNGLSTDDECTGKEDADEDGVSAERLGYADSRVNVPDYAQDSQSVFVCNTTRTCHTREETDGGVVYTESADGAAIQSPSCQWRAPDFSRAGGVVLRNGVHGGGRISRRSRHRWGTTSHARMWYDTSEPAATTVPDVEETTLLCRSGGSEGGGWADAFFARTTGLSATGRHTSEMTRMGEEEDEEEQQERLRRDAYRHRGGATRDLEAYRKTGVAYAGLLGVDDHHREHEYDASPLPPPPHNDHYLCDEQYEEQAFVEGMYDDTLHADEEDDSDYEGGGSMRAMRLSQFRRDYRNPMLRPSSPSSALSSSVSAPGAAMADVRAALRQCPAGVHPYLNMMDQQLRLAMEKKSRHEFYCARMIDAAILPQSDLILSSKMLLNFAHRLHISRMHANTSSAAVSMDNTPVDVAMSTAAAIATGGVAALASPFSGLALSQLSAHDDDSGSNNMTKCSSETTSSVDTPHIDCSRGAGGGDGNSTEGNNELNGHSSLHVRVADTESTVPKTPCEGDTVLTRGCPDDGEGVGGRIDRVSDVKVNAQGTLQQQQQQQYGAAVATTPSTPLSPSLSVSIDKVNKQWRHIRTLVGEDMQAKDHIFVQRQISCMCMFDPHTDCRGYGNNEQLWKRRHVNQLQVLNQLTNQVKTSNSLFLK